ncbi:uncharacterized protein DS421_20g694370 [Arachis hypogaea]|nr:uncharacterized protein DS421_20g694370 [Arachis hypogaea]
MNGGSSPRPRRRTFDGDSGDQTRRSWQHRRRPFSPLRSSFLTHLFSLATAMTSRQRRCDGFDGGTATVTRRCGFDGVRLLGFRSDGDVTSFGGVKAWRRGIEPPSFPSSRVFFSLTSDSLSLSLSLSVTLPPPLYGDGDDGGTLASAVPSISSLSSSLFLHPSGFPPSSSLFSCFFSFL